MISHHAGVQPRALPGLLGAFSGLAVHLRGLQRGSARSRHQRGHG